GIPALLQVGTGAEGPAGTGDDDDAHRIVGVGSVEGSNQLTAHGAVEGIHALRAVEGQGQDAVLHLIVEGFELPGASSAGGSAWRLLWKVIGGADKSAGGWHGGRAGARPSREAQEARPAWERRAPAR